MDDPCFSEVSGLCPPSVLGTQVVHRYGMQVKHLYIFFKKALSSPRIFKILLKPVSGTKNSFMGFFIFGCCLFCLISSGNALVL